jgi:hypothetical protein
MSWEQTGSIAADSQQHHHSAARLASPSWLRGGIDGNARLTALTGAILFVLLAALGVTIVRIHPLISEHLFIGLLLIGPVIVKLGSTGYRFVRYYTNDPVYRKKGPPELLLRGIAPLVVLTTIAVFASGVGLLIVGPSTTLPLRQIHKVSFILWIALMAVHVIGHLGEMGDLLRRPRSLHQHVSSRRLASRDDGRFGRGIVIAGGLVGGLVLALLLIPHFAVWVSAQSFHGQIGRIGPYGP